MSGKNRTVYFLTWMLLACLLVSGLAGCGKQGGEPESAAEKESGSAEQTAHPGENAPAGGTVDLMAGITKKATVSEEIPENGAVELTDFAVRLFQRTNETGKNTLISPISVMYALAMTANGADGETRAQMESVLGLDVDSLNQYLAAYSAHFSGGIKSRLALANSIWATEKDGFTVEPAFLQTNADYYDAQIYQAPFDGDTVNLVNDWISEKTEKMIPKMLDSIPADTVMLLINALTFDAEWESIYTTDQVHDGEFTREDGSKVGCTMMYSEEWSYLEDEQAAGFVKPYAEGRFAFAALLPKEGVSLDEYVSSLDGAKLHELLSSQESTKVITGLPKFETESSITLNEALQAMGIVDGFDQTKADFSLLGHSDAGNIFISQVLHKTFISVDEKGTKAGAATVVMMAEGAMLEEPKEVILDRPFVYMLIDTEQNIPIFIGTMTDVSGQM